MCCRTLTILIAWLCLVGCSDGRGQAASTQARLELSVDSSAAAFDFADDPAFAWDRMHVFSCYSTRETVERSLGFLWRDFGNTTIESSDSVILVVFVQNGRVVGWYEQPRSIDLDRLANQRGYSRSEALFDIDRSSGRVELKHRSPPNASIVPPPD